MDYKAWNIEEITDLLKSSRGGYVYIWGAAEIGERVCELLVNKGFDEQIVGFIDSNPDKHGVLFANKMVFSYEHCNKNDNTIFIITSMGSAKLIYDIIKNSKTGLPVIFNSFSLASDDNMPSSLNGRHLFIRNRKEWPKLVSQYNDEIKQVSDIWADKKSKDIFEGLIGLITNGDFNMLYSYLEPVQEQYLDKVVKFGIEETIFDAGCFNINTIIKIIQYLKRSNLEYKRYICAEPVPEFYKSICEDILSTGLTNIEVIQKAVWDKEDKLDFGVCGESGGWSGISSERSEEVNANKVGWSNIIVEADTIDNLCKEIPITFLKMDIEGAEQKALIGARQTILRDKPKCAISVYHKTEDLFKIPLYLKQLNPNYKLYLRYYTPWLQEIVCYAI